jgi:hypothetical protein
MIQLSEILDPSELSADLPSKLKSMNSNLLKDDKILRVSFPIYK